MAIGWRGCADGAGGRAEPARKLLPVRVLSKRCSLHTRAGAQLLYRRATPTMLFDEDEDRMAIGWRGCADGAGGRAEPARGERRDPFRRMGRMARLDAPTVRDFGILFSLASPATVALASQSRRAKMSNLSHCFDVWPRPGRCGDWFSTRKACSNTRLASCWRAPHQTIRVERGDGLCTCAMDHASRTRSC